MELIQIQERLLSLLPMWNYQIAKPFKQLLDEGISLEMYYCIRTLEWLGGSATMSELSNQAKMQKQQGTKIVNRLVEQGFVTRFDDPADRRVVRVQLTDKATEYIAHFLAHDASCFTPMLSKMSEEDLKRFDHALQELAQVFSHLPCCGPDCCGEQGACGERGKDEASAV